MPVEATTTLDTVQRLETPEGTAIELVPAGLITRGVALLIDELIRLCVLMVISFIGGLLGAFGQGFVLIAYFLITWFYGVYFEVYREGATPGKKSQNIRVCHEDGTPIRLPSSVIRNLALGVDVLPIGYLFGLLSILFTAKFQRLGDLAAGTMVVHVVNAQHLGSNGDGRGVAPPFAMSAQEQSLFVEYLERASTLTDARALEIAAILGPALDCSNDPQASRKAIERIATGIRG